MTPTLIEVGCLLAAAKSCASIPGLCFCCSVLLEAQSHTAQFRDIFCSEQCERQFVRTALGPLSLDDSIRIQRRLETFLMKAGFRP